MTTDLSIKPLDLSIDVFPFIFSYCDPATFKHLASSCMELFLTSKSASTLRLWAVRQFGTENAIFEAYHRNPRFARDENLLHDMISKDKCRVPRYLLQRLRHLLEVEGVGTKFNVGPRFQRQPRETYRRTPPLPTPQVYDLLNNSVVSSYSQFDEGRIFETPGVPLDVRRARFNPNYYQNGLRAVHAIINLFEMRPYAQTKEDLTSDIISTANWDATFWNKGWETASDAYSVYILRQLTSRLSQAKAGIGLFGYVFGTVLPFLDYLLSLKCQFNMKILMTVITPCIICPRMDVLTRISRFPFTKVHYTQEETQEIMDNVWEKVCRMKKTRDLRDTDFYLLNSLLGQPTHVFEAMIRRYCYNLIDHPFLAAASTEHLKLLLLACPKPGCFTSLSGSSAHNLPQQCLRKCLDLFYMHKDQRPGQIMACMEFGAKIGKSEIRGLWEKNIDYQRGTWEFFLSLPSRYLESTARSLAPDFMSSVESGNTSFIDTETIIKQMLLHGIEIQLEKRKQEEMATSRALLMKISCPPASKKRQRSYKVM
jgi:hypothetical protein